jgi:hypothetical protein
LVVLGLLLAYSTPGILGEAEMGSSVDRFGFEPDVEIGLPSQVVVAQIGRYLGP